MGKSITLLGMGRSSKQNLELCGEVWGLNNGYDVYGSIKFDKFFALHDMSRLTTWHPNPWQNDHITRLDMMGCPIMMQETQKRVRQSRAYPIGDLCRFFSTNYFIGSPSYMLALAIYEGASHIRTYGFDHLDAQHAQQRSAWTYWMAQAQNHGVKIDGTNVWLGEYDIDHGLTGLRAKGFDALTEETWLKGGTRRSTVFAFDDRVYQAEATKQIQKQAAAQDAPQQHQEGM